MAPIIFTINGLNMGYTHDLVDATAQLLQKYAHNIRKLVRLEHGDRISISVDYEKVNGEVAQVLVSVFRDEDGDFFFNEYLVGDLNGAMQFYAVACSPVIKEAALDEHGADRLEDVCRDFVEELRSSEEAEEGTDFDLRQSVSAEDTLREMIHCLPSENEEEHSTPNDDSDDDEIIEIYHGGEFVPIAGARGTTAPAASHPANEPEEDNEATVA